MKRKTPQLLCILFAFINLASAQSIQYATGHWDRSKYGNHRAVIETDTDSATVWTSIPWRRIDNSEGKAVLLIDAATGKSINQFQFRSINAESANLVFEPASGRGIYYLYYMPYTTTGTWYFPNTVYPAAVNTNNIATLKNFIPSDKNKARVLRFESANDFNSFYPMEVPATDNEVDKLVSENKGKDFLLFFEDRKHPIKMAEKIPMHWTQKTEAASFYATASRNEFFVFQIGLYTPHKEVKNIRLTFSTLKEKQGKSVLPSSAARCFNVGGNDWLGNPCIKKINVQKGAVQALWIGVDIPEIIKPGVYEGTIEVAAENTATRILTYQLNITDSILKDRGYDELFRMARLNWLDSKAGLDDKVFKPYTPVKAKGNTIHILGRSVQFNPFGFPKKIVSTFSNGNTSTDASGTDILNGDIELIVLENNKKVSWKGAVAKITNIQEGAVSFSCRKSSNNATLEVEAKMECDGYVNYTVRLTATQDLTFDDIQLQIPYSKSVAKYVMGMGYKGGKRTANLQWKWNIADANNMLWMGDVNAGLQCKLKNITPDWTLYDFKKTGTYKDWSNNGLGGCNVTEEDLKVVLNAYTGAKKIKKGEIVQLNFGLLITPLKPLDNSHWSERYFQADPPVKNWRNTAIAKGATVMNVHQGNVLNPYINYPFIATDTLKNYIKQNKAAGIRTKIYYTVRELSNHAAEIWALRSLGDEVYTTGLGTQMADQFAKKSVANVAQSGGSWLIEHLRNGYDPAWHNPLEDGGYDMSIRTQGLSRWHNYYIEGLGWLAKNTGMRGIYLDGVGYDREIMKRVRKVLDRAADSCLIDFHSGNNFHSDYGLNSPANQYLELFTSVNSLWLGEGYNPNEASDYWLVEMSGIPFGLYSEMLMDCGNPYRGMLYGMSSRLGWTGCDPSSIWKLWDEFGIKEAEMIGYWNPELPILSNNEQVKTTVYKKKDAILIVYAGWNTTDMVVSLQPNWEAMGMKQDEVEIYAPEVPGLQHKQAYQHLENINIPAKKGGFIIMKRK